MKPPNWATMGEHVKGWIIDERRRARIYHSHLGDDLLENVEANPEVVCVEVLVLRDVLELGLVLVGAHGALAENELRVAVALCKVTPFLVILSALAALHHEGSVGGRKVSQQGEVHRSSKVVTVRDGHVLDAIGKERIELRGVGSGERSERRKDNFEELAFLTFPDPTRAA